MGNTAKGFTTYTFMRNGIQECFTIYHPLNREHESLPVIMTAQVRARNTNLKYNYINFVDTEASYNKHARKYGYATLLLSSSDGKFVTPCKLEIFYLRHANGNIR